MQLADGLARVRELLVEGRRDEAHALLHQFARTTSANQPWLQLIDLTAPTADEVAYLEWFVRQEEGSEPSVELPAAPRAVRQLTATQVADGLAKVRGMLGDGRASEAQRLLQDIYATAAAQQAPWLQFLVLDPPDADELAYLEEFLRRDVQFDAAAGPSTPVASMPSRATEIANTFMTARAMVSAGRREEGKRLLRQLTRTAPDYESAWLQLLALDPMPAEEIGLIEEFLQHHARHRFAKAFGARLETVRMVAMLAGDSREPATAGAGRKPLPLGDYLIRQGWATTEQLEHAVEQQRALRAEGVEQSLGTLLMMYGHVRLDELAVAFAESSESGFGGFGDYLVRSGVLSAEQVGRAMAEQAAQSIAREREYAEALAAYRARLGERRKTGLLNFSRPPVEPQRKPPPRLGDVLVAMGLLSAERVEMIARQRQREFESLLM